MQLYERSLDLKSFKILDGSNDIDIMNAPVGTEYQLSSISKVTIIDPYTEYVEILKTCFDFPALSKFANRPEFSMIFDGMHGAGGPFAKRILVQELGLPEVSHHFTLTQKRH
jgi:phosphoglucomutase